MKQRDSWAGARCMNDCRSCDWNYNCLWAKHFSSICVSRSKNFMKHKADKHLCGRLFHCPMLEKSFTHKLSTCLWHRWLLCIIVLYNLNSTVLSTGVVGPVWVNCSLPWYWSSSLTSPLSSSITSLLDKTLSTYMEWGDRASYRQRIGSYFHQTVPQISLI